MWLSMEGCGNSVVDDTLCSKIITTVASMFTSYYVHLWPGYFSSRPLSPPLPSFDARAVTYPNVRSFRDYMSWRQVDCWSFFRWV